MKRLILIMVLFLTGCITGGPGSVPLHVSPDGITYELFYIQGMPCMRFGRGTMNGVWKYDGVSCDWSKWNGK